MRVGGKCSASAGVSTEVTTSHTNGKASARVAGTSTRCHGLNGRRNRRRGIAGADALTSWPPSRDVAPEARQLAQRLVVPEARKIVEREARGSGGLPPGPTESRRREAAARS